VNDLARLLCLLPLLTGCDAGGAGGDAGPPTRSTTDGGDLATGDASDGDGSPDSGAAEAATALVAGPDGPLRIDRYEAARPDASLQHQGTATGAARSRLGVLPWSGVTLPEAEAACAQAGARLCTCAELLAACQGAGGRAFPYGTSFAAGRCNDYHGSAPVQPTGSSAGCQTPEGVADLVGNLAELCRGPDRETAVAAGGSCRLTALAVSLKLDRCAAQEQQLPVDLRREDVGFRCCDRAL